MIIDCLQCRDAKEDSGHPRRQTGSAVGDKRTEGIENEAFERMVVKGAAGIGNVEAVMTSVNVPIRPLVDMHRSVPEVLPGVELCLCVRYGSKVMIAIRTRKKDHMNCNAGTAHQYANLVASSPYLRNTRTPSFGPKNSIV